MLNEDQKKAFDKLKDFIDNDKGMILLSGYAGTGKTFTMRAFLEWFRDVKFQPILMTAPTHKALKVLSNTAGEGEGADFKTVHSSLGLKEHIKSDGQISFMPKKGLARPVDDYEFMVVDEASMVNKDLFGYLIEETERGKKIIFIGDEKQIPPVKETEAPVFDKSIQEKYDIEICRLTKIMRQKEGSAIIDYATSVRKGFEKKVEGKEVEYIEGKINHRVNELLEEFFNSDEFKDNPDHAKVIAWTNAEVNYYNDKIRSMIYGRNADKIMVGEKLIANTPVMEDESLCFSSNAELVVTSRVETTKKSFHCYQITVKGEGKIKDIYVIHEESEEDFAYELGKIKRAAVKAGKAFVWKKYYEFLRTFADLKYNYAITAHKCLPLHANVLTKRGISTMGEIISLGESSVISGLGKNRRILSKSNIKKRQSVIIKTSTGREFVSSRGHRFLTQSGYKKAKDLSEGEFLSLYRSKEKFKFKFINKYYCLGLLVGDGCYSYPSNRVDITIMPEGNIEDCIKRFFMEYGFTKEYSKKDNKAITYSIENRNFREKLLYCGLFRVTGKDKSLPSFQSKNQKANFIRGLMDADGSASKNSACIRLVNISEKVIDECMIVLQEFGIISTKTKQKIYSEKHNQAYVLSITGTNAVLFNNNIGFGIPRKQKTLSKNILKVNGKTNSDFIPESLGVKEQIRNIIQINKSKGGIGSKSMGIYANKDRRVASYLDHKNLSYFQLFELVDHLKSRGISIPRKIKKICSEWIYFDKIISIKSGPIVPMADIEVETDNNFIYNGAIVHNSQGSTYKNVLLMNYDIDRNKRTEERNRIKYTAITRASEYLGVVS